MIYLRFDFFFLWEVETCSNSFPTSEISPLTEDIRITCAAKKADCVIHLLTCFFVFFGGGGVCLFFVFTIDLSLKFAVIVQEIFHMYLTCNLLCFFFFYEQNYLLSWAPVPPKAGGVGWGWGLNASH